MGKNTYLSLLALWILLCAGTARAKPVEGKSTCILARAEAEIGVRELSGRNDGRRVEQYLHSVGLGKGHPWCAAFVSFVLQSCGVENPRSGYSPYWFRDSLVYKRNLPGRQDLDQVRPADVFGIYFTNLKRIAHVGLIAGETGNYFITIEGNTNEGGSRDGDGVYRKRRLKSQIYAVARFHKPNKIIQLNANTHCPYFSRAA